jgi:DNA-directed RNA polymerase
MRGRQVTGEQVSTHTLNAVNALQNTAWQINSDFLDVVSRLPDSVVGTVLEKSRAHNLNPKTLAGFHRRIDTATELRHATALYTVIQLDYRGRFYPVVGTSLRPQGDDFALALLRFAPPAATGHESLRTRADIALKLAATDHYGTLPSDPRPLPAGAHFNRLVSTRLTWVRDHEEQILATAADPETNLEFWASAKKPWQFLAWCIEWAKGGREYPEGSTLPVRADCTNSVYQHLACLLRNEPLAEWTNLTRESLRVDRSPVDFYAVIATRLCDWLKRESKRLVKKLNEQRHSGLRKLLSVCDDVLTRDFVKSPAMTWAYGAGPRTLSKKFQEGLKTVLDGDATWAGPFLVRGLEEVLRDTVPEVLDLRGWLADAASNRKDPIRWQVPVIGFPAWMRRSYTEETTKQLTGEINRRPVRPHVQLGRRFDPAKHARAFMPNYVHSLDAAVVTLAIEQLVVDGAAPPLGTTHDAFTTTAAQMDRVQAAVREAMQRVYGSGPTHVLSDLASQLDAQGIDVSAPPRLGRFDINGLSDSLILHS